MARQDIDIGAEGNDGTGDSIRESFRKSNENFRELFAVFGKEGTIDFTTLGDTPDALVSNTIPLVNSTGTTLDLAELASDSALDPDATDTITFDYSVEGKLVISTAFTKLSDDPQPFLNGPLDARNNAIGNVAISPTAAQNFNDTYNTNLSVDDLVITKGYADRRYISTGLPIRVASEPQTSDSYVFQIEGYLGGYLLIPSHGIDRAANGSSYVYNSLFDDADNLTSGETYFIRYVNDDQIALYNSKSDAELIDNDTALSRNIRVSGDIAFDDSHTITDAGFDPNLSGNFLKDVAMPRESIVRRQGDEMTGELFLSDHPGELSGFGNVNGEDDLQAATKFYVDTTSFSSTQNIFVSTSGDDRMIGVPAGREGTSQDFAFRTINAAAQRAAEVIQGSEPEPGPYLQTVTRDNSDTQATVTFSDVVSPQNEQARKLIELNKDYIAREYIGYINFEYPTFVYDNNRWQNDIESLIGAVAFDINRGDTANTLTRRSAEVFYATPEGRFKIRAEREQLVSSIEFARDLVRNILQNSLYLQKNVDSVDRERSRVVTSQNHNFTTGNQVVFKNMQGMEDIEDQTAYVRVINETEFELYRDSDITEIFDISEYGRYSTGGIVGLVFQPRISEFESIKILQTFDEPNLGTNTLNDVDAKFDLFLNIIQNGISVGATINPGNNYKITLESGSKQTVDQADPENLDMIPGKIIVGKNSGARGRIVSIDNNSFELIQLNARDFEIGETVEYGNFVKKKQITLFVESGIYEEDFPIKLSDNVSLKGDEFRRVILRPNRRFSQSKWADTYFYKDLEFDNMSLLDKRHSTVSSVADSTADSLTVDDTSWMSIGTEVKFVGKTLFAAEVEKRTGYFITSIISETEITISETQEGSNISFSPSSGTMYIVDNSVAPFLNQTNQIQGYFGRHYLTDYTKEVNVGTIPTNLGNYSIAANIVQLNKVFLIEELISYSLAEINQADVSNDTSSIWFDFTFDTGKWQENLSIVIDSIARDLERGNSEFTLQAQGDVFRSILLSEQTQFSDVLDRLNDLTKQLLEAQEPQQQGTVKPDISLGPAEAITTDNVEKLKDLVSFAFDSDYNPPKLNDAAGMDVFQMGDATILRNITVQGHGGFMVVLDPESQILTKSPYIQTGSSFSKSDNEKRFRGGMLVDAFVGNIPARIVNVEGPFVLDIESDTGQGLFIRQPQLPAPFYVDGIRYQVNAIPAYDSGNGTARLVLDSGSNPDNDGIGQGYLGADDQEIFIQTAGNRSMLGNDFTQINDLGYGLVTNNGAFSEMVSMFTYYCQAAYYANNGSEIRSLNGSNGYGFFGLIAEGADPNEIPDQVTLANPMVLSCKAFTTTEFPNSFDEPFITVYDFKTPPTTNSVITVNHGPSVGILNYKISSIENITEREDVSATGGTFDNTVYRLSLKEEQITSGDFFGVLQATVTDGTFIEFRNAENQIFNGVRSPLTLEKRPSTAINYDESDLITYRSLNFSTVDNLSNSLGPNTILAQTDTAYDFIEIQIDFDKITGGFGSEQGDNRIAVKITDEDSTVILEDSKIERLTRDVEGRQPDSPSFTGGMIFSFAGKTHQIMDVVSDSSVTYIEIQDVPGTNINDSYSGTGLNTGFSLEERVLIAGLPEGTTAEITQAISLLRATGHDFTQIGAGGYNDSNYPNVILGQPQNSLAPAYEEGATAESAQVWERRKGRVFFVTTDQDGFFRVGKFFTIDQATGTIQFAGDLGLSNAESLGFSSGTVINEFSTDDSFVDNSSDAVPTERAVSGYISRVLGIDLQNSAFPERTDTIGPGFLSLNGNNAMKDNLDLGQKRIQNVDRPLDGDDAATKNYVDEKAGGYDTFNRLRNIELNSVSQNDLLVATGNKRIFVTPITGGTINIGEQIATIDEFKTGLVIDLEESTDPIEGNINIITYLPVTGEFQDGETIFGPGETASAIIIGNPVDEFANGSKSVNSVINLSVTRDDSGAEYNFQIQDDSITNADVSSIAGVSQSKLSMQKADVFDEDNSISGWSGTGDKLQSDLGLAVFSNKNFETNEGFVRIKSDGLVFEELRDIPQYHAYGRQTSGSLATAGTFNTGTEYVIISLGTTDFTAIGADANIVGEIFIATGSGSGDGTAATTGDPEAVSYSDIVRFGDGLEDVDFDNTVLVGDSGFPGSALVKLSEGVYGVTEISTGIASDTIARRDQNGALDAASIRVAGFRTLSVVSSTIRLDAPSGERVFSSELTNGNIITTFPGNIDVGQTARTNESVFQSVSSYAGEGWLASDWVYTSFIEAAGEGDSSSTGIGIGAGGGFASSAEDTIIFATGGANERLVISNSGVTSNNNLTVQGTTELNGTTNLNGPTNINGNINLGNDSGDKIGFIGKVNTNVLPDVNGSRNIGSSATRWDVVYADIFNGVATEAKYADLAEKYTTDSDYEPGTVLIFGGQKEVTTTAKKGDRRIAGVVSTAPAYLMNSDLVDCAVTVALQGRVPCKVLGKVAKGDMLVSSAIPGYAVVDNNPSVGTVIGKSLDNKTDDGKSVIEIVVGKT